MNLLRLLNVIKNNFTVTNKRDYRIIFNSNSGKDVESNFFTAFDGIVTTQEYSDLSALCPHSSLVFTTSMPSLQSQLSSPYIFENGHLKQIFGNIVNQNSIISDLATQDYSFRSNLLYNPTAEYRRITLLGTSPLTRIDLYVWVLKKDGRLSPFYLHPNSSASIKILFERND